MLLVCNFSLLPSPSIPYCTLLLWIKFVCLRSHSQPVCFHFFFCTTNERIKLQNCWRDSLFFIAAHSGDVLNSFFSSLFSLTNNNNFFHVRRIKEFAIEARSWFLTFFSLPREYIFDVSRAMSKIILEIALAFFFVHQKLSCSLFCRMLHQCCCNNVNFVYCSDASWWTSLHCCVYDRDFIINTSTTYCPYEKNQFHIWTMTRGC